MSTTNSKDILLKDGRFILRTTTDVDLGSQEKVLREHVQNIPFDIPSAFILPGGIPVGVQCTSNSVVAWAEVQKLNLSTVWTITDGGVRYPVFKKPQNMQSPPEHEASHLISPIKAGMRLFFLSLMRWDYANKRYIYSQAYLVARGQKRKEFFRPPLPNIHSDGKVCMGNDLNAANPCLADLFLHVWNHFLASKWNSDLSDNIGADMAKALYSIKDNEQQPLPSGYKFFDSPACPPIVVSAYSELPIPTF